MDQNPGSVSYMLEDLYFGAPVPQLGQGATAIARGVLRRDP